MDYLSIVAHYIDRSYQLKSVLLALYNTFGNKTGAEMKHHLLKVAHKFKISTRLNYFVYDNASNNDKAIELLATELFDVQPKKQRLRCTSYIINLICKSILYGVDMDCVNKILRTADNYDELAELYDDKVGAFEKILNSNDKLAKLKA